MTERVDKFPGRVAFQRLCCQTIALLILNGFATVYAAAQASHETTLLRTTSALPACPLGGGSSSQNSSSQAPQAGSIHHKVTLSWDVSAPSSTSQGITVGYCVYRRKEVAGKTLQNPTLADHERLSAQPITGASCVDDQVDSDTKYFYVVTAVNAQGSTSSPTKEIQALVPDEKPASAAPASAPPCRGESGFDK
jgi:hypothetical protein